MSDSAKTPRHWIRESPLWVGAGPLLIFLLVAAVDLTLAETFTSEGKAFVSSLLGGVWLWMVVVLFLIAMGMTISPLGSLRLGGPEA